MAGVNLLKQLEQQTDEEGVVVETGGGALSEITAAQKIKLVLIIGGFFVFYFARSYVNDVHLPQKLEEPRAELARIEAEIADLNRQRQQLSAIERELESYESQIRATQDRINVLRRIREGNRDRVLRMVDYIMNQLPEIVWIRDLQLAVNPGAQVQMQGSSHNHQMISEFYSKLEQGVFFRDWRLVESSLASAADDQGQSQYNFNLISTVSEVP